MNGTPVKHLAPLILALLTTYAACTPSQPTEGPAPATTQRADTALSNRMPPGSARPEPGDTTSATFGRTAGVVDRAAQGSGVSTLRDVRTARHDAFDRVVFEFEGAALPDYHVEYVDEPVRACGSGEPVSLAGDGWLQVRMSPAQAHTDEGVPTVTKRERQFDHPVLLEIESICDFEADVTWVLGLASPNRYRVTELSNPARLVIDVRH